MSVAKKRAWTEPLEAVCCSSHTDVCRQSWGDNVQAISVQLFIHDSRDQPTTGPGPGELF